MSTSIILLDRNFNANDVDIMVFEPVSYFPPVAALLRNMIRSISEIALPPAAVLLTKCGPYKIYVVGLKTPD